MKVMGFKHGRDWEAWSELKRDVESRRSVADKVESERESREKEERRRDNETAYEEWLSSRGRRIIATFKEWEKDGGDEASGKEAQEGERRRNARKERPWKDAKLLTPSQRDAREAAKGRREEKEKEEREAAKALAEGVFLEWLAAKTVSEKRTREDAKAAKAKELCEMEKEKDMKWRKKVVVCCYEAEAAKNLRGERIARGWTTGGGEAPRRLRGQENEPAPTLTTKERKAEGQRLFADWVEGRGGRKIVLQQWVKTDQEQEKSAL